MMTHADFKEIVSRHHELTFVVAINILEVTLKGSNVTIHPFQPPLSAPRGRLRRFQWEMDGDLIQKVYSSHFGQEFESAHFEEMWCLRLHPHFPQKGESAFSVRLCCLPPNAQNVQIRFSVHCKAVNFKNQRRATMDYEAQNQSSEPIKFLNLSKLKDIESLTVVLEIEIVHIQSTKNSLITSLESMDVDVDMFDDSDSDDFQFESTARSKGYGNDSNIGLISFDRPRDDTMDELQRYKAALKEVVGMAVTLKPKPFRESRKIVELRKLARKKYAAHTFVIESDRKEDEVYFGGIIEYIRNNKRRRKGDVVIRCKGKWLSAHSVISVDSI